MVRKILCDTSVYGRIIERNEVELFGKLIKDKIIVYGNKLIRKELRDTPKKIKILERERLRNLRIYLLTLYDEVVRNHSFEVTNEMIDLAEDYYAVYKELGGGKGKESILNDFIIVACASIKKVDIVVSEDEKSMLSRNAIRAYKLVNKIRKERTPNFINYEKLKQCLRSGDFDKISDSFFEFGIFNILFVLVPYFLVGLFFLFHSKINFVEYINFLVEK